MFSEFPIRLIDSFIILLETITMKFLSKTTE